MRKTGWRWLWVALVVVLIDRATKYWAVHSLEAYQPIKVFFWLNKTLSYNRGASFGFLNEASGWQTWMFGGFALVVSIGILIWLKFLSASQRYLSVSLSLILGGALGNLWDRLQQGYVVDFIQVHWSHYYFPTFNVADSAICLGAFLMIFETLFIRKSSARSR